MIELGLALLAVGIGDLVSGGLGGDVASWRRALAGTGTAVVAAGAGSWWTGVTVGAGTPAVVLAAFVATLGWSLARVPTSRGRRPRLALVGLGAPLAVLAVLSGRWPSEGGAPAAAWLAGLPFPALAGIDVGRFCLFVGTATALLATANGVVRVVLEIAGTPVERSAQRLRGGRLIGPLERLMIFGLAVAGEPTAAALIVSAKSLLRFPEISRVSAEGRAGAEAEAATGTDDERAAPAPTGVLEVDYVTEYFLLGSLTSWVLALVAVPLLRG